MKSSVNNISFIIHVFGNPCTRYKWCQPLVQLNVATTTAEQSVPYGEEDGAGSRQAETSARCKRREESVRPPSFSRICQTESETLRCHHNSVWFHLRGDSFQLLYMLMSNCSGNGALSFHQTRADILLLFLYWQDWGLILKFQWHERILRPLSDAGVSGTFF